MKRQNSENVGQNNTKGNNLKKEKFIKSYFASLGNISESCRVVGIARKTYYEWLEKDADFKSKIFEANEAQIDFVESQLLDCIKKLDTTTIIFFLKTKGKSRGYIEKNDTTQTTNTEITLKIE